MTLWILNPRKLGMALKTHTGLLIFFKDEKEIISKWQLFGFWAVYCYKDIAEISLFYSFVSPFFRKETRGQELESQLFLKICSSSKGNNINKQINISVCMILAIIGHVHDIKKGIWLITKCVSLQWCNMAHLFEGGLEPQGGGGSAILDGYHAT